MNSPKRAWQSGWHQVLIHLGILAGIVLVTASTRIALRERQAQELRELGEKSTAIRAREIEAYWMSLPYTDATGAGFTDSLLGALNIASLGLSQVQQKALQSRLCAVMDYFLHPSSEGYWRLWTEGLRYEFKPTEPVYAMWTNRLHRSEAELSADPFQTFGALWNGVSTRRPHSSVTAVCLTNVSAAISPSNTLSAIINGPVRKGLTVLRTSRNPGFEYFSPRIVSSSGSNKPAYLHLSFFAKAKRGTTAGPIYLNLRWLPEQENWEIEEVLSDSWLALYTPF